MPDPDDFFPFAGREEAFEDIRKYGRHGLHPVLLGDILPKPSTCVSQPNKPPRYRIHLKIGFGAFSIVWLAFDLQTKSDTHHWFFNIRTKITDMGIRPRRFVSVKICQGSESPKPDTEATLLQHIKDNPKPGSENTIDLYDSFVVRGPNGYHGCLVTEVVIPLGTLGADGSRLESLYNPRSVIEQVARGFAYLHTQGIAHGGKQPRGSNAIQARSRS